MVFMPEKVYTTGDLLMAALIRNECREFMTRDRYEITVQNQVEWWNERTWDGELYLYYKDQYKDIGYYPIGYGLRRFLDGKWWVSGGLIVGWRERGLGKELFGHLTGLQGSTPTWLEVLTSNTRARKLYEKLGYKLVEENQHMLTMCFTPAESA